MMKKKVIWILVVISICIVTVSFAAANNQKDADSNGKPVQPGDPKAYVTEKSFIFDDTLEGEVVTHAFLIENQGTAPLKVLDIHTSCGCTTAERPESILPGARDWILVKGNTRGYGDRSFKKTIIVTTNDPQQPIINLELSGHVVPFAKIEPRDIVLRGKKDEILEAKTTITPNSKSPFRILSSKTDNQLTEKIDVNIEYHEGIYKITVINRDSIPGSYRGRIILATDSKIQRTLSLFVKGYILE